MKPFKIIYYVFLTLVALIALLVIVSVFPITGNIKLLIVQSGSMEPAIKTGSIVVVVPASDYKVGDIITFGPVSKINAPVTHRIYEVKEENGNISYITKGDANNAPDFNEIAKKNVLGKVMLSVPYVGYLVDVAKKPYGFMFIIIVPAAIIIFDEIKKIRDEVVRIKKKNQNQGENSVEKEQKG